MRLGVFWDSKIELEGLSSTGDAAKDGSGLEADATGLWRRTSALRLGEFLDSNMLGEGRSGTGTAPLGVSGFASSVPEMTGLRHLDRLPQEVQGLDARRQAPLRRLLTKSSNAVSAGAAFLYFRFRLLFRVTGMIHIINIMYRRGSRASS